MLHNQQVRRWTQIQRFRLRLLALVALSASVWLGRSAPALAQDIYAWGEPYGPTPVPIHYGGSSALASGWEHGLATDGDLVIAWGANFSGQLGDSTTMDRLDPVVVDNLTGAGVVALAGGWAHSLAVTADGTVWAWGDNAVGQLGDGTMTDRLEPVPIPTLTDVVAIAAGRHHSLALTSDGLGLG
jgi:alpha-tubulin suppressor-like RCC1 family protein